MSWFKNIFKKVKIKEKILTIITIHSHSTYWFFNPREPDPYYLV